MTPDLINAPVALITGGAGDLAQALAVQLWAAGWQVLTPDKTELDVRSSDSVQAYFGGQQRLDLLINNAGCIADGPVATMTIEGFDQVLAVNLDGCFRCCRAALPLMQSQGWGHIINISSYAALNGTLGQANYAAAKAGVIGLTQSLASELGPHNIRCNCVLPGFLETKMTRTVLDKHRSRILAQHSLGRLNTVEEAARFIIGLQSFEHVSGQVFQLDSR
jgi:3-oxoacyl-[acyl-carrier protein] reductase